MQNSHRYFALFLFFVYNNFTIRYLVYFILLLQTHEVFMSRNHEVILRHPLLTAKGELLEPGWSRSPLQIYDRTMIQAPKWRIKEWDYYLVLSENFAGAFTISDDGYIGLQSVSLLILAAIQRNTLKLF